MRRLLNRIKGGISKKNNIYTNNNYPRILKISENEIFNPISITLFASANPRLPKTFSICNKAYTFIKPFEKLQKRANPNVQDKKLEIQVNIVNLELQQVCFCPTCEFSWIFLMYECPECNTPLIIEETDESLDSDKRRFYVRGIPHLEINGQTWIEGAKFTLSQLSEIIYFLFVQKDEKLGKIREKRWEKWLLADYIEIRIPNDHLPEPFNRQLIRKNAVKVKDSFLDIDYLILNESGFRVIPMEQNILKRLGINVVPIHELGWKLRDDVVMKEQFIDLANLGQEKTARKASNDYTSRSLRGG